MVHRLTAGEREVFLVGTAHVSRQSTELVRQVIAAVQPDTVCVELCGSRYQNIRQAARWSDTDLTRVVREKKALLLLANLLLAAFQKRIASRLEVQPGAEMLAAIAAAEEIGAAVHLADRDIRVTLRRTWSAMRWRDKLRAAVQLLSALTGADELDAQTVERLKHEDVLQGLLAEVGNEFPSVHRTLIVERDRVLARRIRTAPGRRIVAVVGAGHVPGIQAHWDSELDTADLERLPPPGRGATLLKWVLPISLVALMVCGFAAGGVQAGGGMLGWWALTTGALAGLGALLALAHPLTILSSIVAAPLTTIHPLIAAGWVSGLVEAFSRRPKVRDFEALPNDIQSFRGFWRNSITRILLVVVFTNLGASAGTLVAIPLMLRLLG
jgi:pheromone shutdown-related protein TraB